MLRLMRLQMLDDRLQIAHARWAILRGRLARQTFGEHRDRADIGLEAEQARPDLVVQFECGAAPLVVLRGDQPLVQPQVLGPRRLERFGQRVEAVGDGGKFTRQRPRQSYPNLRCSRSARPPATAVSGSSTRPNSTYSIAMTATLTSQRHPDKCNGVLPDLCDLVARLGDDLYGSDALAVDDDRHVACSRPARRSARRTSGALRRGRRSGTEPSLAPPADVRPHPSRRSAHGAPDGAARRGRSESARPAPPAASSPTASPISRRAISIEAAISTPVAVRALRIVTAPATSAAITSITTKTMSSCARIERPCHNACARPPGDALERTGVVTCWLSDGEPIGRPPAVATGINDRPGHGADGNVNLPVSG